MSFGFFPFRPPTEEEQEEIKKAHERHQMELDQFRHDFQRLFEELQEDQLTTLRTLVHILAERHDDPLAASWEGMIGWELKKRFNVCLSCGVNHEKELQSPPQEAKQDRPLTEAEKFFSTPDEVSENDRKHSEPEENPFPMFYGSLTQADRELMEEYHLDDVYDEDTQQLVHFACTGIKGWDRPCGVTYPTLEDRMMKGPEECSGCFVRMAQG